MIGILELIAGYLWMSSYVSNKGKVTTDQRVEDQHIDSCLYDLHRILSASSQRSGDLQAQWLFACYKPTDMSLSSASSAGQRGHAATCLESVLRVLGLEAKKVSDGETLSDLGVDSLQVVTIKSILKGKGIELAVPDIYKMKVSDIKQIQ